MKNDTLIDSIIKGCPLIVLNNTMNFTNLTALSKVKGHKQGKFGSQEEESLKRKLRA